MFLIPRNLQTTENHNEEHQYQVIIILIVCCCCCCCVPSVESNSVRPHRQQPTRLPCPWDSPGKNTGVGCHFLLQCMKVKSESEVAQSCPTLCDPMDCSPPGSSVHGIFQARVLEWGAIYLHPWDFPGKNTGVGCYCLLLFGVKIRVRAQIMETCNRELLLVTWLLE